MTKSAFDSIAAGLHDAIEHAKGTPNRARVREVHLVDVSGVREGLGMSQHEFADAFGVSVATVRNWEQGRREPRGPARVLLQVIASEPDVVRRVLLQSA